MGCTHINRYLDAMVVYANHSSGASFFQHWDSASSVYSVICICNVFINPLLVTLSWSLAPDLWGPLHWILMSVGPVSDSDLDSQWEGDSPLVRATFF